MKYIFISMLIVGLGTNSCEKPPFLDKFYSITVKNNSSEPIRVLIADKYATVQYPDTSLPAVKPALQKAEAGKSCYFDSRTNWEENLQDLPADTLSIYFISNSTYENEDWSSVRANYNILKRIDLSIQDIQAVNYKIEYP